MLYCQRCNKSFLNERSLGQHRDNSKRHNICRDCDSDFATSQGLIEHFIQEPRHIYCSRCDKHFDDADELWSHYEEHHHFASRAFFDTDEDLHAHFRLKHWYCVACRRVFESESNLNTHLHSSAKHNKRTIACPGEGCRKAFISYADLTLHLESGACRSMITRSDVNTLAVSLDRSRTITNPSRLVTGTDGSYSRPSPRITGACATEKSFNGGAYECILCHRTFVTLSRLNIHLNSAAHDDKIYRCPVRYQGCAAEFKTLSGLLQHVESQTCDVLRFQTKATGMLELRYDRPSQSPVVTIDDSDSGGTAQEPSTIRSLFSHDGFWSLVSILLLGLYMKMYPGEVQALVAKVIELSYAYFREFLQLF